MVKRIGLIAIISIGLLLSACSRKLSETPSVAQISTKPQGDVAKTVLDKPVVKQTPPASIKQEDYYESAYKELAAMLQGTAHADFERAIFLSENPYYKNAHTFGEFQKIIDFHQNNIAQIIAANDQSASMDFSAKVNAYGRFKIDDIRYLPEEKKQLYLNTVANWAIFTYLTDTLHIRIAGDGISLSLPPYSYAGTDPFGMTDWSNSQVMHLLNSNERQGNCYALTALYKILANRFHTAARLCTAPQHIYIQHQDPKGDYYNVELATAGHPGDGVIQILTHTTTDAIMNGIALRSYDERQSIGLCLVNLAKAYEHTFNTKGAEFLLRSAELVLQYDSLNLNALLLKHQVLDSRVSTYAQTHNLSEVSQLKDDSAGNEAFQELENHLQLLYQLGYREMPVEMQKLVIQGSNNQKDITSSPYTSIQPPDPTDAQFHTMFNGAFQEVFETNAIENYGHFSLSTDLNKIVRYNVEAIDNFLIDPVAFAYDFGARIYDPRLGRWASTDNIVKPHLSPYQFGKDNPVIYIDVDGNDEYLFHADGTWAVNRQDGKDVFLKQENAEGVYQKLETNEFKDLKTLALDLIGESDLDFISTYAMNNEAFQADLYANVSSKKDKKILNDIISNAWATEIYKGIDRATDALSLGSKAVAKEGVEQGIKHGDELAEVVVTAKKDRVYKLYKLFDKEGNFLKWGHTTLKKIERRYSGLKKKGWTMQEVKAGPRDIILKVERFLVRNKPGLLNKEKSAGKALKSK